MAKYLHPGSLSHFGITLDTPLPSDPSRTFSEVDCAATVVTFVPDQGVEPLLDEWMACAMNETCIGPAGSDRENSRQDQSALTILSALIPKNDAGSEYYHSCHMPIKEMRDTIGVWFHRFDAYVCFLVVLISS